MKKHNSFLILIVWVALTMHFMCSAQRHVDLIIIGSDNTHDGLGKIAPWLIEHLQDRLSIMYLESAPTSAKQIKDLSADVLLYAHSLSDNQALDYLPEATVTIAYSVFESSKLPKQWVKRLNKYFDCVVVADQYLLEVYDACDVTIPIFVLPHGFYLEDFMQSPLHQRDSAQPFVFGMTGTFLHPRKNHLLLLDAFVAAFAYNPAVQLKIHTRGPNNEHFHTFMRHLNQLGVSNVFVSYEELDRNAYKKFLEGLDCYVLPSSGEGYSLTPRESLALGIPTIISHNTAHVTICNSGFVYAVPCEDYHEVYYPQWSLPAGYQSRPRVSALQHALEVVYTNYATYLQRAHGARSWLEQYCAQSLVPKFCTLFKPQNVYYADRNTIDHNALSTRSTLLYKKYLKIKEQKGRICLPYDTC